MRIKCKFQDPEDKFMACALPDSDRMKTAITNLLDNNGSCT